MKALAVLSLMIVASTGYAASAAPLTQSDYSDVSVVSVTPRNPADRKSTRLNSSHSS